MEGQITGLKTALILMVLISVTSTQQAEVVNTTLGPIQGLRKNVLGTIVDIYYGIPFAKPPIGNLRFKRPEPAEPWTEVKMTDTKPNACFQNIETEFNSFPGLDMWNPTTPMSEDCLFVNLWVPRGSQSPKTTMIWIHGGGFYSGSSMLRMYDGSKLASTHNVIVASLNYRVGPLGFLYTGTLEAPGNQGLMDQVMALKWVHDNVVSFGGRQDSITIFGESAGAISGSYHLVSPYARNYFTRVIMQSGAPSVMTHLPPATALRRAKSLSELFDCPEDPMEDAVRCLRKVSAENVTAALWELSPLETYVDLPMRPVVDGYFFPDDPAVLLAKGDAKDTQLLIGANRNEGTLSMVYSFQRFFPFNGTGDISEDNFKRILPIINLKAGDAVDKALMFEYVDRILPADRPSYGQIVSDITTDQQFICPTVDFANAFLSLNGSRDVYLYYFEHRLSSNPWPQWMGVMHGYEIEAVFGLPEVHRGHTPTAEDVALSNRMMSYWANFAKTGNPNGEGLPEWPKLTLRDAEFLWFKGQGDEVGRGLRYDQCTFRSTILPLLPQDGDSKDCSKVGQAVTAVPGVHLIVFCMSCVLFFLSVLM